MHVSNYNTIHTHAHVYVRERESIRRIKMERSTIVVRDRSCAHKQHPNTIPIVETGVYNVHRLTGVLDLAATLAQQSTDYTKNATEAVESVRGKLMPMSAKHESEIMIQHGVLCSFHDTITGTIEQIQSPPCVYGQNKCVGMSGEITGFTDAVPGVVLMAYIFEDELRTLMNTGTRPIDWHLRGCVLCVRRDVSRCLIDQSVCGELLPLPLIIQPWDSPTGVRGAYKLSCVHSPCAANCANSNGTHAVTNGLVSPFVKYLGNNHLTAIPPSVRGGGAYWRIDQSPMIQAS